MSRIELGEKTHAPTAGQTVGPFFKFGLEFDGMEQVAFPHSPGAIVLGGTIYDGEGQPIPDGVVEIFGADADGSVPRARGTLKRDGHSFTGYGRAFTNDEGHFEFWTRNPGSIRGEAPFFAVVLWTRGLPNKLHTRIYLPEDAERLAADPLLSSLDEADRATLIARRTPEGYLEHDFRLQGEGETVFLSYPS
ncbi:MAG TPA: protocatechuate 3,4-dioxygenase subunit alpha [Microbacterium sp.]|nr:protocatechuate 3,4-dioxygenase subunit alpha [Microbacterium sp.]